MLLSSTLVLLSLSCFAQGTFYGGYSGYRRRDGTCQLPSVRGLVVKPFKRFYQAGETVELSCDEGYEFKNKRRNSTCRVFQDFFENGQFMPAIFWNTCKELPLCRPPRGEGVVINSNKTLYEVGEKITISCQEGYDLVGSDTFTCKLQQNYYGEGIATFGSKARKPCREIRDCGMPRQRGLIVEPMKMMYKPGEKISLKCQDDYELIVSDVSTCENSGHFSFERLDGEDEDWRDDFFIYSNQACRKKARCSAPDFPGLIVSPMKSKYIAGEEITLSCKEGFELTTPNTSVCGYSKRDRPLSMFHHMDRMHGYGTFSPKVKSSTCSEKVTCRRPREEGLVVSPEKKMFDVGETVTLSCRPGYVLKGSNSSTCESRKRSWGFMSGAFSPMIEDDICERIASCDKPEKDGLVLSPEKDYYEIGDKINLSCDEGYEQAVAPVVTCMRTKFKKYGTFDPSIGRRPCRKPTSCTVPADENAIITPSKDSYAEGETVQVSCAAGYKLVNKAELTCERALYCKGQEGEVTGCFHPQGSLCLKIPTCKLPQDDGLVVTPKKEEYQSGEQITISCDDDYQQTEPFEQKITCKQVRSSSHWPRRITRMSFRPRIPGRPCKKKPQCKLPEAEPGLIVNPAKEKYTVGEEVKLSCGEGYKLTGSNSSTCMMRVQWHRFSPILGPVFTRNIGFRPTISIGLCERIDVTTTTTTTSTTTTTTTAATTTTKATEQTPTISTTELSLATHDVRTDLTELAPSGNEDEASGFVAEMEESYDEDAKSSR